MNKAPPDTSVAPRLVIATAGTRLGVTEPPDDAWPVPEEPTVISRRETVPEALPPAGPPPDRRIGAGMLLGLGAVALVAIGILLAYLLTHRNKTHPVTTTIITSAPSTSATAKKVTVPRFVGMKEQSALVRLGQIGLRPKEIFESTAKPTGLVISQAPQEASEVAKGSQVTLVIARHKATTTATTTAAATTTPTTTATTTTATTATTTAAPPPSPNATVPDVTGQNEPTAVQAMGKVGILASLVFVPSEDPLGTVVQQAKPAGTTVPFHSHVQINLSNGPNNTANVQIPNVVGQTLTQALGAVNGAHLRLIYLKFPVTQKAQAGKVVQQSPLGGGQAPQNAQVLVYLGAFHVG
jgi:beta-lactam-binding protein with PASTA domain